MASPDCPLTGKLFAVQGGCIQELTGWSAVSQIETDGPWRIDQIARRLGGVSAVTTP